MLRRYSAKYNLRAPTARETMSATAHRTPPDASEDSLSTQHTEDTGLGRTVTYRRHLFNNGDEAGLEPQSQAQIPRSQTVSYKSSPQPSAAAKTQNRRSFAERTKSSNMYPNWMDKPLPPEPTETQNEMGYTTPQRPHPLASNPYVPHESPREQSTPPTNPASQQSTPVSRSGTTSANKRDWASDRSPLQKLEVALDGISKEEKRARVLEAELRVKERLQQQQQKGGSSNEPNESPAPSHGSTGTAPNSGTKRRSVVAPSMSDVSSRSLHTPQGINPEERSQDSEEKVRREKARAVQGDSPSLRYAAVPRDNLRYVKPSSGQPTPTNTSPRRAVSVSHHPERREMRPTNRMSLQENTVPKRTVSQLDPTTVPPRKPVPGQSADLGQQPYPVARENPNKHVQQRGLNPPVKHQPPAAGTYPLQSAMATAKDVTGSNESTGQTKPKRNTVSFNVPPPTPPPQSEWKNAPVARLGLSDFEYQNFDIARSKAWWGEGSGNRRRSRALPNNYQVPNQKPACKFSATGHLFRFVEDITARQNKKLIPN